MINHEKPLGSHNDVVWFPYDLFSFAIFLTQPRHSSWLHGNVCNGMFLVTQIEHGWPLTGLIRGTVRSIWPDSTKAFKITKECERTISVKSGSPSTLNLETKSARRSLREVQSELLNTTETNKETKSVLMQRFVLSIRPVKGPSPPPLCLPCVCQRRFAPSS